MHAGLARTATRRVPQTGRSWTPRPPGRPAPLWTRPTRHVPPTTARRWTTPDVLAELRREFDRLKREVKAEGSGEQQNGIAD